MEMPLLLSEKENADLLKRIGSNIAHYRDLRNMTQNQLAQKISISKDSLSRIERGCYNRNLSVVMLYRIAKGLDVDLSLSLSDSKEIVTIRIYP
jgi:transcriptional regulator with XRE-family HTH domain